MLKLLCKICLAHRLTIQSFSNRTNGKQTVISGQITDTINIFDGEGTIKRGGFTLRSFRLYEFGAWVVRVQSRYFITTPRILMNGKVILTTLKIVQL